ncbi:MAG: SDR family NAD(P)-dependent oxidoreductase [Chromatiales bacterium]|nr:SDR family NAD(P)-dependent oxidoreductase [Chromatiales bacterium]
MGSRSRRGEIAIVGMACRFPGLATSPGEFWRLLDEGRDAVTEIGDERWTKSLYHHPDPKARGRSYTWAAGVLEGVDQFDAEFFGIAPREAAQMDPQQRLLLEMAWEALEDGGQVPSRLAGSGCGVWVGISGTDYANSRIDDPASGDAYFMTGGTLSIAANRLSYVFDLHGPSMAIDTACSSSLVALHQACQSLLRNEVPSALVGGVNMLLTPFPFIGFSKASMLAPDGRCRAFDAAGSGYVRAEGGAVLFLKPLAAAEADGDPVHAVIRATAVNSDGRTRGLSMPNASAQESLLRSLYGRRRRDLDPADVVYVEAHGTGTAAGDPQEAAAIGRALGTGRAAPLPIGSVKSNIGHLEPASGLAGLMKVVLALENGVIPASLHFASANPSIPFAELNLEVVTERRPLPAAGGPMLMGVNSFGFGGTNAHVVVERYAAPSARRRRRVAGLPPLLLSARSEAALGPLAARYAARLAGLDVAAAADVCHAAATRRQHHVHRLAVVAGDVETMRERLQAYAVDGESPGAVAAQVVGESVPVALLFSGNGAQWPGMARRLLRADRTFRRTVTEVDERLREVAGLSVLESLRARPSRAGMDATEIAQPALFAVQVGLLACLRERGIRPVAVLGHSVGEVAAAYAAGAFDLEQAVHLIHERSAAQAVTRGAGRMAALGVSEAQARAIVSDLVEAGQIEGRVEVAAVNSPLSVTLSGPLEALEAIGRAPALAGAFYRILDLDYAFHSAAMEPVRDRLLTTLSDLRPATTAIPFVSTVTGTVVPGEMLDADYWWRNVREPVRLDLALAHLIAEGVGIFLEVGPQPIMQTYLREAAREAGASTRALFTLRRDSDDLERLDEAVLGTWAAGGALDLETALPISGAPAVRLPGYPWQRESHWFQATGESFGLLRRDLVHPLLGFPVPHTERTWERQIDTALFPYLADHVVGGAVVFPAAGFVEMALAAGRTAHPHGPLQIDLLEIRAPLVLDDGDTRDVRSTLAEDGTFRVEARPRLSQAAWTTHATCRVTPAALARAPEPTSLRDLLDRGRRVTSRQHYHMTDAVGLVYGPAFRGVVEVRVGTREARARIGVPESLTGPRDGYIVHPTALDACLQVLAQLGVGEVDSARPVGFVPYQLGRLVLHRGGLEIAACRVRLERVSPRSIVAGFELLAADGTCIGEIEQFRFRRMRLRRDRSGPSHYQFRGLPKVGRAERIAPLPRPTEIAERLVPALTEQWYEQRRADYYGQVLPLFDALVAAFVSRALHDALGKRTGHFTFDALADACGCHRSQRPWLARLLAILEEDGVAIPHEDGWSIAEDSELDSPEEIWRLVLADFPAYLPEVTLAGRIGMHLLPLLRRGREPGTLTAPAKGPGAAEYLEEASPAARILRPAVIDAVLEVVRGAPEGRPVRILEIGSGSVGLASQLTSLLPERRFEYVFTTADEAVLASATAQLGGTTGVKVMSLDLVLDPTIQGLRAHGFDVIVAPHSLHRVRELDPVLEHLRRLLAGDGLLMILERAPERLTDLILGADPAWWQGSGDQPLTASRLPTVEEWQSVLQGSGFVDVVPVTEPAPDVPASSHLLIARNPEVVPDEAINDAVPARRSFVLLADADELATSLAADCAERLRDDGHAVVVVRAGAGLRRQDSETYEASFAQREDLDGLWTLLGHTAVEADVVSLLGLAGHDAGEAAVGCASLLHLVQSLAATGRRGAHLWLVGVGASALPPDPLTPGADQHAPAQAARWGFGRVLMNEHPELGVRLVDLQAAGERALAAQMLADELTHPDDETEIVLGVEGRYVARLEPWHETRQQTVSPASGGAAFRLDFTMPGPLTNLRWQAFEARPPGPGEIQIAVRATGLNFRDVMYAMGMLSDEAVENGFAGATLGMECAGDVVALGSDVTGFKVGDSVVCFAPACFSSLVTTATTAVAHKPNRWSYAEAATVPSAFFTVYYALHHLAQLQPGERVLLHGAAGGVGMAAIQYARYRGAEVFATAGTEEKRDFLRLLGVEHVLDSRSLDFADEVMRLTGGAGIDVVLNSLSGEAVTKNLEILRPFGRFLELGKRDFYENARVGLRPFRNNISYFGIDADQLLVERSALAGRLFREVMTLLEQRAFRPLVHRAFSADQVTDAFRYMQQSRQIGKVVLTYETPLSMVSEALPEPRALTLPGDATYLVTGGLGGFGLATARWLAARGARHLALLGRSGAAREEARTAVEELTAAGVQVHVLTADVADRTSLDAALAELSAAAPAVRGVIHAAMVLDDGLIRNLDPARIAGVLGPKARGALNLHEASLGWRLDFFVMYSSATTAFGNPGQASYVAANCYLESLARARRAAGLPAIAVGWGPIADVGYLARNTEVRDSLDGKLGGRTLTAARALDELEQLLLADRSGTAVLDIDWRGLARVLPAVRDPRFSMVVGSTGDDGGDAGHGGDLRVMLAGLPEAEMVDKVATLLVEQVAKVLRTTPEKIDRDRSIYDLGMDSLMAVELHMAMEERFGVSVPMMAITEGAGIRQLASRLSKQIAGSADASGHRDAVAALVARHAEEEHLTDDQLDELVTQARADAGARRRLLP